MADEKKPKIDLKARLGKNAAGGATPPPPAAGIPAPTAAVPTPAGNALSGTTPAAVPAPAPAGGGLPVPPGIPVGPPPAFKSPALNLDPSNPLHAAMAQPAAPRSVAPAPPPQPQRIEVDELTVQEARKGARKQGLLAGVVLALVLGAVGYIAGGALETSKGRAQSVAHAKSLATDVNTSREQLKSLADKIDAARNTLGKDHKFPDTLARDLSGINVDFDGTKLAGVRFSGFSQETTTGLIEYITAVQALNDRKVALASLCARLQKPMTEMLAAQASGKAPPVNFIVLINKDKDKNAFAQLAPLQKPYDPATPMPAEFTATDTLSPQKNGVTAPKFQSLDKPGAAIVIPKSLEAACPSETAGQLGQLVGQIGHLLTDIRGEGGANGDVIQEPKPGLLDRADRLITNLNKVQ